MAIENNRLTTEQYEQNFATFIRRLKIRQRRWWKPTAVCFVMMRPVQKAVLPVSIFQNLLNRSLLII